MIKQFLFFCFLYLFFLIQTSDGKGSWRDAYPKQKPPKKLREVVNERDLKKESGGKARRKFYDITGSKEKIFGSKSDKEKKRSDKISKTYKKSVWDFRKK